MKIREPKKLGQLVRAQWKKSADYDLSLDEFRVWNRHLDQDADVYYWQDEEGWNAEWKELKNPELVEFVPKGRFLVFNREEKILEIGSRAFIQFSAMSNGYFDIGVAYRADSVVYAIEIHLFKVVVEIGWAK